MCFSLYASIFTGSLATLTGIVCLIRNRTYRDKWNGIWIMFLASMQWWDAMLWYMHDNGYDLSQCSETNHVITVGALVTIMLEPLGNLCGYMYASRKRVSRRTLAIYAFCFLVLPWAGRRVFGGLTDPVCGDEANNCCSVITDGHHVLYGYAHDSSGETFKCWNRFYFFGEMQEEIPLGLRVLFLVGIIYPYKWSNPFMPGLINAVLIVVSWVLGYYSDAHASVWCWGASLQSVFFLLDPLLFPYGATPGSKALQFRYYENESKEARAQKKRALKVLQSKYSRAKVNTTEKNHYDAIVIGSGIGGLATAALLAQDGNYVDQKTGHRGRKVLVLEQHYRAGGCMHTFDEFDGEFDSGIHYVGAIARAKLFLSLITTKLVEWYEMGTKSEGVYDLFDLDGNNDKFEVVTYRGTKKAIMDELVAKFPESKEGIEQYFEFLGKYASKITYLYVLSKVFPNCFLFDPEHWVHKSYVAPIMRYTRVTANEVIDKFIKDPKLRAIIGGGQLIDWCLIPKHASWWVVAAMMNYYIDGAFYPKGGSNNIPLAIIPIIKRNGGDVVCQAKVKKVLIDSRTNNAIGVEMDKFGDKIYAPLIVSGVGAHTLFFELIGDKNGRPAEEEETKKEAERANTRSDKPDAMLEQKIDELKIMENVDDKEQHGLVSSYGHMTAFVTLSGTSDDLDLPDYNIHSWNNLDQYDYDISKIQELFYSDPIKYGDDALICLTFPSAKDPYYDVKFPNKSNVLLLTEAKYEWFTEFGETTDENKYGKRNEEYLAFKKKFEKMFLDRLHKYCPKVKGHILNVEIGSPLSSEYFLNTYKGGSYGLSWNTARFNHEFTRKFFHSTASGIGNLYITGESSLFGGFVGALCSGYVTAIKILGWKEMIRIIMFTRRLEE